MHKARALIVGVAIAGHAPGGSAQPVFRTGVELLVVDARVVDGRGGVVPSLRAEDFQVQLDGRDRRVVSAEFVSATTPRLTPEDADISSNVGSDDRRTILLAIDQGNLDGEGRQVIQAASRWVETLPRDTMVGLAPLVPPGPNVEPTLLHGRVLEALARLAVRPPPERRLPAQARIAGLFVSLSEALEIAGGNSIVERQVKDRECPIFPPNRVMPKRECDERVSYLAVQMAGDLSTEVGPAMSGLTALIDRLKTVPGRKDLVVVTRGWPMATSRAIEQAQVLAVRAARSRVTLHVVVADDGVRFDDRPDSAMGTMAFERTLYTTAPDAMAGLTGGLIERAAGTSQRPFDRIAAATSGYYRLGVEVAPEDVGDKPKKVMVRLSRRGLKVDGYSKSVVIAPRLDAAGKTDLVQALRHQARHADVHLRVATAVIPEPEILDRLRLVVTANVQRAATGAAETVLLVSDPDGRVVWATKGDVAITADTPADVSAVIQVAPGRYDVRLAVRDREGRVGTVVHPVDALPGPFGVLRGYGLMLFEHQPSTEGPLRPVLGDVASDDQLVARVDVERVAGGNDEVAPMRFQLRSEQGDVLAEEDATSVPSPDGRHVSAGVVFALDQRPPGRYEVAATLSFGTGSPSLTRWLKVGPPRNVIPATAETVSARDAAPVAGDPVGPAAPTAAPIIAPFDADVILGADIATLVDARLSTLGEDVRHDVARQMREGRQWLAEGDATSAAKAFQEVLRVAPSYRVALAFLGAAYASAGGWEQAAGAWQTASMMERDSAPFHRLAIDGWLRARRPASALASARRAVTRWPDDMQLRWRLGMALLWTEATAEGVTTLLSVPAGVAGSATAIALAMAKLHDGLRDGRPVWDGRRDLEAMRSLRAKYPADGPDVTLVDTWLREAAGQP